MEIAYRRASKADYQSINDFHNRIYKSNRSLEQFSWEFERAPAGESVYIIALDGDRIVGTNCVIPIELYNSATGPFLSGKSEDTLVDPDYRGHGIFNQIYNVLFEECVNEGIEVIWGFTPARAPFKKIGFEIPYDHSQSLMVFDVLKSFDYLKALNPANGLLDKLKIFGLSLYSYFRWKLTSPSIQIQLNREKPDFEELSYFLNKQIDSSDEFTSIYSSPDYLKWRFQTNPYLKNLLYLTHRDKEGNLKASAFVNIDANDVAHITFITFHSVDSKAEREGIVYELSNRIRQKKAIALRNWVFSHTAVNKQELEAFKESGHVVLNRGMGFVWKNLGTANHSPDRIILSRLFTQGLY